MSKRRKKKKIQINVVNGESLKKQNKTLYFGTVLAVFGKAAINIHVQVFVWT